MPVVSVVMVFHRDTPFLRPAIASVLAQTLGDLELMLVDNGTGLRPEALGELGSDLRLRWVRLASNVGIAAGHNAGVAAARGEYIALLDYDDIALPVRLERQVARLRADPLLGLVSSLADSIDERGEPRGREFALLEPREHRLYSQYAAPFFTPACMGRRELFRELPYREPFRFCADFDFVGRALERANSAVVPEVLLQYRRYPGQTTVERAVQISAQCCIVRLLAARRRAGRPERLDELAAALVDNAPADMLQKCAQLCLEEGFAVLAAYHARRSVAEQRTLRRAARAMGIFVRAIRVAPAAERALVAKMFFTGPVRALGLRPA